MTDHDIYDNLVRISAKYEILMNAILNAASLDYDLKELYFDSMQLVPIIKALDYESYSDTLIALQEEKRRKYAERPIEPMD